MDWATFILVVAAVLLAGCSEPNNWPPAAQSLPPYAPATFRIDVTRLIGEHRYQEAAAYLQSADAKRQAVHDRSGFIAVAEDAIVLPGGRLRTLSSMRSAIGNCRVRLMPLSTLPGRLRLRSLRKLIMQ